MTTLSQQAYWTNERIEPLVDPDRVIYGGTATDLTILGGLISAPRVSVKELGGFGFAGASLFVLVDTPLSIIADTLLLPLTLGEAWWLSRQEDQERTDTGDAHGLEEQAGDDRDHHRDR